MSALTLASLKGQTLEAVEVEDGVARLEFSSGDWLKFPWNCLSGGHYRKPTELQIFLAEMARRRQAQWAS